MRHVLRVRIEAVATKNGAYPRNISEFFDGLADAVTSVDVVYLGDLIRGAPRYSDPRLIVFFDRAPSTYRQAKKSRYAAFERGALVRMSRTELRQYVADLRRALEEGALGGRVDERYVSRIEAAAGLR